LEKDIEFISPSFLGVFFNEISGILLALRCPEEVKAGDGVAGIKPRPNS
jgi:hypothetical protein